MNEPNFVLCSYFRIFVNIICALLCYRHVSIYVFIRYIVCCSLMIHICAVLVTLRSKKVGDSKIVFSNSKISMSRVRYIRLHVESADLKWGRGQVSPGTVRCEDNRVVYGGGAKWEGRRDGTASVVFWAGQVWDQAATG